MSMFLWLQALEDDEQDESHGNYAMADVTDTVPSGTSISYVLITEDRLEPWNLDRHLLRGNTTVKPPTVYFSGGALVDELETESSVPPQNIHTSFVPPQLGEKVLLLLLSKGEREYVLGDLAEEFATYQSKYGIRFAKVWYYKQVISSACPLLRRTLRLGVFVWVEEWVRRYI